MRLPRLPENLQTAVRRRHASHDAFVVEAWMMPQREMAEFVRSCKALNAHGALRRHEDAGRRITQICAQKTLQRPKQKRQVQRLDRPKHIDIAAPQTDLFA